VIQSLTYIEIETQPWLDTSPPADPVTWRFAQATAALPRSIEAIPSLVGVEFSPAIVSLGENLGQRATLTVRLTDHRHRFGAEPFDAGTFWGKWRARYGTRLRGRPLRWITGAVGQALEDMTTWHFVIESTDGPTPDGVYTIVASDILKLADGDRALYPRPCDGFLIANISNSATTATLAPSGIGNIQYATSGFVAIGGKEVCQFTRVGDALTLTRAATIPGTSYETEVVAHQAGSRVQMCERILGEDAADILYDILTVGAGVPSSYIDLPTWQGETAAFLGTVYTTLLCEPTAASQLLSEIIAQAALSMWWDAEAQRIRLRALRNVATVSPAITEREILVGSLRVQEQPNARISEVMTYYGLRNPLKGITDPENYRSALLGVDLESEDAYGSLANKTVFSRWIPFGGGTVANRLNNLLIGRFRDPPRRIGFDLARTGPRTPGAGAAYDVGWRANQDITGAEVTTPVQVTRLGRNEEKFTLEAEELIVTEIDEEFLTERVIVIDTNIANVNLRTLHDAIYPPITDPYGLTVRCIINAGVNVTSTTTALPALRTGSWIAGLALVVENNGIIQGAGGAAGAGASAQGGSASQSPLPGGAGNPGGPAFLAEAPVSLINKGPIRGGGGGGGGGGNVFRNLNGLISGSVPGGGGGGGAGQLAGTGGAGGSPSGGPGAAGNSLAAGVAGNGAASGVMQGGPGGAGGGPGLAGQPGSAGYPPTGFFGGDSFKLGAGGLGGAAGAAIAGIAVVSLTNIGGTIAGPTI